MLAGKHPYPIFDAASGIGETSMQAAHVHLPATPLPAVLPGCPDTVWGIIARCLEKRPEHRFARAEHLTDALRAAANAAVRPRAPMNQQILREAEDASRASAVRSGADARERLKMAQMYNVTPNGLAPVAEELEDDEASIDDAQLIKIYDA